MAVVDGAEEDIIGSLADGIGTDVLDVGLISLLLVSFWALGNGPINFDFLLALLLLSLLAWSGGNVRVVSWTRLDGVIEEGVDVCNGVSDVGCILEAYDDCFFFLLFFVWFACALS